MRIVIKLVLLSLIASGLIYGGIQMSREKMDSHIHEKLNHYGFKNAAVQSIEYKGNHVLASNIALDKDKFSTIQAIRSYGTFIDFLLGKEPRNLTIDDIKLTGSYDSTAGLQVSGWTKRPFFYPDTADITLNGGQLDLMTSVGALRFQAKGTTARQPDGSLQLQAALWSIQHQLKINTVWEGVSYPDGRWLYNVEFNDGGIKLDNIHSSRLSGWLSIDKTKSVIPAISGQINAGQMNVGDINLNNFVLTLDGPFNAYELIAKGNVMGFKDMVASLDMQNSSEGPQIDAAIETNSLDDLLTFLGNLKKSDSGAAYLTPLLLTSGNIHRLRKDIDKMSYDALELQIIGPLYDLAGKIIVKKFKDGVVQKHVISLEPATDSTAEKG